MKTLHRIFTALTLVLCSVLVFATKKQLEYNPDVPVFYNQSGRVLNVKNAFFDASITPTTANNNVIDFSAANFLTIRSITITAEQSTGSMVSSPIVSIQSNTLSTATVNILTSNSQVVSALGAAVTGLAAATNLSGMKLNVHVVGTVVNN